VSRLQELHNGGDLRAQLVEVADTMLDICMWASTNCLTEETCAALDEALRMHRFAAQMDKGTSLHERLEITVDAIRELAEQHNIGWLELAHVNGLLSLMLTALSEEPAMSQP
jgi:hypothetical protein